MNEKEYAQRITALCSEFELPFDVGLALGTDPDAWTAYKKAVTTKRLCQAEVWALHHLAGDEKGKAATRKAKNAIQAILGDEVAAKIRLGKMGTKKVLRLSRDLIERIERLI